MRAPRTRPRARGDGLGIKRLFSQGLASHRGLWSTPACGSPDSSATLEPEVDDGVEDDDGPRSSSRAHLARRILHGSRVFSGVDTSVDIVPLPLNRILARPSPPLLSSLQLTMRKVGFEWSSRKVHRSRLAAAIRTINYSSNSSN